MSKRAKTRWSNVIRYPDGTYYAFIKPIHGGPAKEYSLRTKKATLVPDALKIAELKVQRSMYVGSKLTFNETIDDHLAARKSDWKPRTYETNRYIVAAHLKPFFGKMKIADIDHNAWDEFTAKKIVHDYMNQRSVLRNFLEACVRKNWIGQMPLDFKLPKHKRRPRKILKPNQIRQLFTHASGRLEIFIHLMLFNGPRPDEARTVKFEHVNFVEHYLTFPDSKTGVPRTVPLLPETLALIKAAKDKADGPYLFSNRNGSNRPASLGWHRKGWKKLLKQAGLAEAGITPHDLRATAEKYVAKDRAFTGAQREKMFGASVAIQNSTYVTEFFIEELRGMERVMLDEKTGVPGLAKIIHSKAPEVGELWEGSTHGAPQ